MRVIASRNAEQRGLVPIGLTVVSEALLLPQPHAGPAASKRSSGIFVRRCQSELCCFVIPRDARVFGKVDLADPTCFFVLI